MPKVKLVIFDLDGTLVDAYPAINASFNFAMRKFGYPARGERVIRKSVGWGDSNLLLPFVSKKDLPGAVLAYRRHHRMALLKGCRMIPYSRPLLRRLKREGYNLAVASNRPSAFSRIIIRHLGLDRYFDYMLCADKLRYGKPHPEILRRILERFSLGKEEALYVGDMAIDARAGRRSGIKTVIVTGGSSSRQEIVRERPYRVIGKIKELIKVLAG